MLEYNSFRTILYNNILEQLFCNLEQLFNILEQLLNILEQTILEQHFKNL